MCEELIKRLRRCAYGFKCRECEYENLNGCRTTLNTEAADAIEELQKQLREEKVDNVNLTGWLAEEHAKHLWIPVTERLPEKDQEVLIFLFGEDPYIAWHNGEYWSTEDFQLDEPDDWQPTYWFPLPQPPESDGES